MALQFINGQLVNTSDSLDITGNPNINNPLIGLNIPKTVSNPYNLSLPKIPTGYNPAPLSVGGDIPVYNTPTPTQTDIALKPGQFGTTKNNNPVIPPKPVIVPPVVTPPSDSAAGIAAGTGTPTPSYQFTLSPEDQAAKDAAASYLKTYSTDANQVIDPAAEYQNTLARYQASIDATNKVYADKLNQSRIQGQGRIESRQFSQGRSGQIGSGTGEAGVNAVQDANTQANNAILDEQNAAVQTILGKVNETALQTVKDKTAAKKAGADALLTFYDNKPTRDAANLKPVIATLVSKGIDPSTLTPADFATITNGLGVSKEAVLGAYKDAVATKATADAATKKAQAELDQTIAQTAKTKKDTELLGQMTPAQKADLAEKVREFGLTYALDKWKAENPTLTNPQVNQFINTQMATPEFKAMNPQQKSDFILANGGTPSDFGY